MTDHACTAINLNSFYASVECRDRNLDPMTTNLVVADESRAKKTICLAVCPENSSVSSGQVLQDPYEHDKAKLVVREMTDILALDLVEKRQVTDQFALNIAYDEENLTDPERRARYTGPIKTDSYGRQAPQDAHGSINLPRHTSSAKIPIDCMMQLLTG